MESLSLLIDGLSVVVDFEVIGHDVDLFMIDGAPTGALSPYYVNYIKNKLMETME